MVPTTTVLYQQIICFPLDNYFICFVFEAVCEQLRESYQYFLSDPSSSSHAKLRRRRKK